MQLIPFIILLSLFPALLFAETEKNVFRMANTREIETLDPPHVDGGDANIVARSLNEGLVRLNPQTLQVEPGLASRWAVSSDQLTYEFTLRPELKFSDGRPLKAEHFLLAFRRNLQADTAAYYAHYFDVIAGARAYREAQQTPDWSSVGIHAINQETIRFRLQEPAPYFLELLSNAVFYPLAENLEPHSAGKTWVGSGAFRLRSWALKDKMVLEKNPYYYDAKAVKLDQIIIYPIEDPKTAWNMYEAGEVDWIRSLPSSLVSKLRQRPDFHSQALLNTVYLRLNTQHPQLKDARLRKALSMAIQRSVLTEKVTREGQIPAYRILPTGIESYPREALIQEDLTQARALLAEAGYPQGRGLPEFQFIFPSNPMSEKLAIALSTMWVRNLGVRVSPKNKERAVFYDQLNSLKFQLARSDWTLEYNDPKSTLEKFTSLNLQNNLTGFKDSLYDQLIDQASHTSQQQARFRIFDQAEKRLIQEEAVLIPLYTNVSLHMWKPYVKGLFDNARLYYQLREVEVARPLGKAKNQRGTL